MTRNVFDAWYRGALLLCIPLLTTQAYAALSASPNPSSSGNYKVSWTAIADATKYQLGENGAFLLNTTNLSHSVTGKSAGNYTYTLRKCTLVNGSEQCGQASGFANITVVVETASLSVPTGLNVAATNTSGSYSVTWNSVSGATGFSWLNIPPQPADQC